MTLYERTIEISKKRGISLKTLAREAGLAENSIYDWKKSTPKADNLQKVADVLNVSTDYLLGRSNELHLTKSNEQNTNSPQLRRIARRSDIVNVANNMVDLDKQQIDALGSMVSAFLKSKKND